MKHWLIVLLSVVLLGACTEVASDIIKDRVKVAVDRYCRESPDLRGSLRKLLETDAGYVMVICKADEPAPEVPSPEAEPKE